jgi:multidrug efflux pump subunit AcrA (membrane-fusion protein)
VTRVPAGIGRIVNPGEALFHIEDTTVLKLNATVSEADAPLVATKATIVLEGATPAKGTVTAVLRSLDPQTRRVPVIAEIPIDASTPLLSGSFVRANIQGTQEIPVLKLPASALRPGSQDEVVVSRAGKAHLIRVTFTAGEGGALLVRDGLAPTDDVVVSPSSEVHEGDNLGGAAK